MEKDKKALREMRAKIDKDFEDEQSKLFAKWNVSFVFGQKQIDEYIRQQRTKGYEGEITGFNFICPGMVGRLEGAKDFISELVAFHKKWKTAKRNAWTMDTYIEHQLWDHECFYTGDYLDGNMTNEVRYYFPEATDEDFYRVYNEVRTRA